MVAVVVEEEDEVGLTTVDGNEEVVLNDFLKVWRITSLSIKTPKKKIEGEGMGVDDNGILEF